jgi:hypothetical protein
MFDIDWWGLALPFAYIVVLVGSLVTASSVYRKRKAGWLLRPTVSLWGFSNGL